MRSRSRGRAALHCRAWPAGLFLHHHVDRQRDEGDDAHFQREHDDAAHVSLLF
ncbi:hypothetical protein Hsero_2802 [Herbaspirillum seropedicae SmR1]|uniref:Uncharacterized protein n=1 Tax=Herbaspirillum seropedicae (strain SmR1) TaxID=757424 RepID=D8IYW2_HERSS|nr:hypothetical protein Hsero_2802 [Herbaspirillum seropedicae SmR1]